KYLQVLAEGTWSVYKDVQKTYTRSNYDPVFQTGNRYDKFEEKTRYLFVSPDGEWSVLIPRRRAVERFFDSHSRETRNRVRDFVEEHDLDYGKDADLARVFGFLNEREGGS